MVVPTLPKVRELCDPSPLSENQRSLRWRVDLTFGERRLWEKLNSPRIYRYRSFGCIRRRRQEHVNGRTRYCQQGDVSTLHAVVTRRDVMPFRKLVVQLGDLLRRIA